MLKKKVKSKRKLGLGWDDKRRVLWPIIRLNVMSEIKNHLSIFQSKDTYFFFIIHQMGSVLDRFFANWQIKSFKKLHLKIRFLFLKLRILNQPNCDTTLKLNNFLIQTLTMKSFIFFRSRIKWPKWKNQGKSFNNSYQCLPKYKKFLQFLCNLHFNIARVMCTLH